ncbi:PREDICTED: uncharacterized protein LOC104812217 [Tarenaya hassleriana]|uniref:uncharacterized protein LOC104812217 n=1 Tax=Tarenaya hassleriana TaxID=28532 RepID=UPI00053C41B4|nr:PREDICTED: uncharacterized protein LOC104812217 [Tarenaya hassleriana]
MTDDRVYPASRPPTTAANPTFPATKAQLYNANRPAYRPPPPGRGRRHSRGSCFRCCCWTILVIILLLLLAAAAVAVLYLIYRPHRPSFTVSSLKISSLNFTSSSTTHLTTAISLAVVARNPNKNVEFFYDDTSINVAATSGEDDVTIGQGSFPAFVHGDKNTTLLRVSVGSPAQDLDELSASKLKGEIKSKKGLEMKIVLDTKVRVKMGSLKTPKTLVRVTCDGIKATAPTGKTATTATTSGAKCKVDLRFKIWKVTF